MRLFKVLIFLMLLSTSFLVSASSCIPVDGLSFEKIGYDKLLVIKNGKNYAILTTCGGLPVKIGQFRFFSEQLCNSGAENKFHIDGQLQYLCSMELYK
jgi:hypothetical protein